MKQKYRDALIEFIAMDKLLEEYRGRQDGDMLPLRSEIHNRKLMAEHTIATELGFKDMFK